MEGLIELVRIPLNDSENAALLSEFRKFYSISHPIELKKELFVSKSSFQKSLNSKIRVSTPFEQKDHIENTRSSTGRSSFEVLSSKVSFIFPSNRTITLAETLTGPNGLTERVELTDSDGNHLKFNSYFQAEAEVVSRICSLNKE